MCKMEKYILEETESGQLRAHYNLFVPEPSNVYTPQVGGPACYEPFSDRIERELQRPQKTERTALTHNLDRKCGQRHPALVTGRQRGTPVKVEISLKGNWIPEPEVKEEEESFEQSSVASGSDWLSERAEVGPETEAQEMLRLLRGVTQLESKVHDLYEKASQQMTEKLFKGSGRTHTMTTRSQSGPFRFQCPLLTSSAGMTKYVPFSLGDVQALVDKLPPIAGCGRV
ncbi:hypothetical protein XENORESO_014869 [Xenotaenia resolanae]|uniref:Uncharacterized protein n=1 Tax=Xenotaenia resolanae TaxID=208358 RepID=A0ABV0VQX0_9TELE